MGNYMSRSDAGPSTAATSAVQAGTSSPSSPSPKRKKQPVNNNDEDESASDQENNDLQTSINLILNYSLSRDSPRPPTKLTSTPKRSHTPSPSKPSKISPELIRPTRKKMKSTSNYIYNTLFVNGENSDICVRALSREWHLHKLYLCQSPYFESMFKNSQWRESNQTEIEIRIPDTNITERSLDIALGSFYRQEISLVPIEVVSVLACASLLSLDGLLSECEAVMLDNISAQTILAYYDASMLYGVQSVTDKCLKWLALNLMINEDFPLESIGIGLLDKILGLTKYLMIIQVETDLYSLCKRWLFYQLAAERDSTGSVVKLDSKGWQRTTTEFFKSVMSSRPGEAVCLLDYEPYSKYASIFRKIRLQTIINDLQSLRLLVNDRIIPLSWIEPYLIKNSLNLLFIDQDHLSNEFDVDPGEFENSCMRFGRILDSDVQGSWRWIGFNYGMDLIMMHSNRTLLIKRNTSNIHSPYKGLLSNRANMRVYYVLKIIELDRNGNEAWSKYTGPVCLDLHKNEENNCVTIGDKVQYPIVINLFLSCCPSRLDYLHPKE